MAAVDTIVAELQCPRCGITSSLESGTGITTTLRSDAQMRDLGVGDLLVERPEEIEEDYFYRVNSPLPGEPIHLMMPWDCSSCHRVNWGAEIVLRDGVITSIEAVTLTRSVLERLNYISMDAVDVAQILTDLPYDELSGMDIVGILRERLPDDDSWVPE